MDERLYQKFSYARGYLLTSVPAPPPKADWASVEVAGLHLSYDRRLPYARAQAFKHWGYKDSARATVAILGTVLDTATWSDDPGKIAKAAARALARSETALLDMIDGWSGRFLLIFRSDASTKVLTDACALRSAYYSFRNGLSIASHAAIVAKRIGAGPSRLMAEAHQDPRWKGSEGRYAGHATAFESVWVLTPNTLIDVNEKRIRRFFPRAPLSARSSEHAAEIVAPILRRTVETICARYKVAISLTGGYDSRVTLAAARRVAPGIEFFTYVEPGETIHETDFQAAKDIAEGVGLRHRRLDLSPAAGEEWEAFQAALTHDIYTIHRRDAAWAYYKSFPDTDIHLRSNLGEIGRAFYRKNRPIIYPFNAVAMADVFKPRKMSDNPAVLKLFRRFYDAVEFSRIENYDPYDMLYWEQRMGSWHTSLVLQGDNAFESLVIFNNRNVLMPLLGAPVEERRASRTFTRMIEILWPELMRWDFV
jgi:hypothetical protein